MKKKVLIFVLGFIILVVIMELIDKFTFQDIPNVDLKLIQIIDERKDLKDKFGEFRKSEVDYSKSENPKKDTISFTAQFKGSKGNLNFFGKTFLKDDNWELLNYTVSPDTLKY
jgi:hypothetical protein